MGQDLSGRFPEIPSNLCTGPQLVWLSIMTRLRGIENVTRCRNVADQQKK